MSEIKKGDLVMVVRPTPCCSSFHSMGQILIAGQVSLSTSFIDCLKCGGTRRRAVVTDIAGFGVIEVYRLRKIDPPSTGEYDGVPLRLKEPA